MSTFARITQQSFQIVSISQFVMLQIASTGMHDAFRIHKESALFRFFHRQARFLHDARSDQISDADACLSCSQEQEAMLCQL